MGIDDFLEGEMPTVQEVCGFDPAKYIGGILVGSTEGLAVNPERFQDVKSTVTNIRIGGDHLHPMLEVYFIGDDGPDRVAGKVEFITVREDVSHELTLDFPYIGKYKIILPRSGEAEVSKARVKHTLQKIRERELFYLN